MLHRRDGRYETAWLGLIARCNNIFRASLHQPVGQRFVEIEEQKNRRRQRAHGQRYQ